MTRDLLGNPLIPDGPAMPLADRKRMQRRASEQAKGYYAPPGTGPEDQTCRSCIHAHQISYNGKSYWKCAKAEDRWGHSVRTDIRLRSPACRGWENRAVATAPPPGIPEPPSNTDRIKES